MLLEINNCITRDSLEILYHRGREYWNKDEDGRKVEGYFHMVHIDDSRADQISNIWRSKWGALQLMHRINNFLEERTSYLLCAA